MADLFLAIVIISVAVLFMRWCFSHKIDTSVPKKKRTYKKRYDKTGKSKPFKSAYKGKSDGEKIKKLS